jgi:activator of HSP90 ATPase
VGKYKGCQPIPLKRDKMKTVKTKTIRQGAMFRATPHEVYEALMDSKKHSKFSGAAARISRKIGGRFNAYDGWIYGKNLQLKKDKLIVQEWRGNDWPKGVYSIVKFILQKSGENTKLMFTQSGVPADKYKDISEGWKEFYWRPMKKMLEK